MKANEFVKNHGINIAERDVAAWESGFIRRQDFIDHFGFDLLPELKRLVESHKLVDSLGGMDSCRSMVQLSGHEYLKKAIADVESCQ